MKSLSATPDPQPPTPLPLRPISCAQKYFMHIQVNMYITLLPSFHSNRDQPAFFPLGSVSWRCFALAPIELPFLCTAAAQSVTWMNCHLGTSSTRNPATSSFNTLNTLSLFLAPLTVTEEQLPFRWWAWDLACPVACLAGLGHPPPPRVWRSWSPSLGTDVVQRKSEHKVEWRWIYQVPRGRWLREGLSLANLTTVAHVSGAHM